jgi:hypothetical protein
LTHSRQRNPIQPLIFVGYPIGNIGWLSSPKVHYYNYSVMVSLDGHNYMQRTELGNGAGAGIQLSLRNGCDM